MRNKNYLYAVMITAVAGMMSTGCSKDDDNPPAPTPVVAKTVANIDATASGGHFAFYSLERNEVVPFTDSATNKWDIAFSSTTIIVNSGKSGPGLGGAFVQKGTTFENYTAIAPDSTFKTDAATGLAITTGSGKGWYNYNMSNHLITPIPGNILVIRTATGKYAKVEITSYYKDAPAEPTENSTTRFYSFRFAYQPDGGKSFN